VGQRSTTETLAGIYQAFLTRRTWKQADLARELAVGAETIRRMLYELREKGMPLDREEDHPHVYWSVPRHWFPGSVLFKQEEVPELLRQLRRIPHGQGRSRLLALILERLPHAHAHPSDAPTTAASGAAPASPTPVIVVRDASPEEERYLAVIEDSASQRTALHMRYLTAGRVDEGSRHASVHRVLLGPPARFVATCHRSGTLKTFRVDGVLDARLDAAHPFRAADDASVDAYLKASLDGFHGEGPPREHSFVVRNPDARWVKKNLLEGMRAEGAGDGIRVTVHTASLDRLARYVVSLGGAATPESPELAREVTGLARGALAAAAGAAAVDGLEAAGSSDRGGRRSPTSV
jgi:predicted DNA-binding transcriptional regulator YafY